jgi:putative redox protein
MKAIARRSADTFTHEIEIRGHKLTVDEPREEGGEDKGATPQELLAASLASCTAITLEMYARRKGWDIGTVEVACEYSTPERGAPTHFDLVVRVRSDCNDEQLARLKTIAAKCPVHRTLQGDVVFVERVDRSQT